MKRSNIIFVLTILLFIIGCSKSELITPTPSDGDATLSFNGNPPVKIDTLQGQFVAEYAVSPTSTGSFSATNYTSGQTLLLFLYDEDENSFPFTNNGVFPVNSDPIRSTIRYYEFGGGLDIEATTGSVTITKYERTEENNLIFIIISGNFNASNGIDSIEGTFNNVRVQCLQCD
ncbi:MAG: hypothetical protein AAF502_19040 [Bacteroidota bacterium]